MKGGEIRRDEKRVDRSSYLHPSRFSGISAPPPSSLKMIVSFNYVLVHDL